MGIPAWARLAVVFHQFSVSVDETRNEACVGSERDSSALTNVVDAVEGWLVRPIPIASVC